MGLHPPAPRAPFAQFLAAAGLQVAPLVALSGYLGLLGMHPPAPIAPSAQLLAAAGLQLAPLAAPSGHLGLPGPHPPTPGALVVQFVAATRLQVVPLVALMGHLYTLGEPLAPHCVLQPPLPMFCLLARETEVAMVTNNMGVQPADVGPAAVTSAVATLSVGIENGGTACRCWACRRGAGAGCSGPRAIVTGAPFRTGGLV